MPPPRQVTPTTRSISVTQLDLDPENPRLVVDGTPTQEKLLRLLYEEESLDELVHSFLQNGYFAEEPLVVVPNGKRFVVAEGNRRLATLKLLLDEDLRRKLRVSGWPTATAAEAKRLRSVPCVVYPDRRSVLPFLGFRHITGAKKWAPFQRARFVAQMLESDQTLSAIEESLGDDSSTIKKLYQDYVVFTHLVDDLGFPPSNIRGRFSLLEVMLGQRPIKKFIGLPHRLPTHAVASLIDADSLDELGEVATWIFGDGETSPIVNDSREIPRLAKVIADPDALEELRASGDLDAAEERLGGEEKYLLRRIAVAQRALRDIVGLLPLHADEPEVRAAIARVLALVPSIERQLEEDETVGA